MLNLFFFLIFRLKSSGFNSIMYVNIQGVSFIADLITAAVMGFMCGCRCMLHSCHPVANNKIYNLYIKILSYPYYLPLLSLFTSPFHSLSLILNVYKYRQRLSSIIKYVKVCTYTECRGHVINTSTSSSAGPVFRYRSRDWLSLLGLFVIFLSDPTVISG